MEAQRHSKSPGDTRDVRRAFGWVFLHFFWLAET